MRILQVNKYYYPDIGGVESVVKQYAENLGEDFDITVLCVKKNFSFNTEVEMINNVKVIRCASFGTFFSMPVSIVFLIRFLRIYKKFDICHFHEPFPLGSLLSCVTNKKCKIVITWHSDIVKQLFLKNFVEIFQRRLCKKAVAITTTSPNLLEYSSVLKEFRDKVFILPLSISTEKTISNRDGNFILYLGRLSYYKGIEVLLEAYEKASTDLELYIVGSGEKQIEEAVRDHIYRTSKKITFVNRVVTENEKDQYFKNCSFFVLPSIEASEAFAIIQLEAMIQGKAVINTSLPTGVPYVSLHNKTGITVSPKNSTELANAMDQLSRDVDLRGELGKNGHYRVCSEFSNAVIFEKLKEMYLQIFSN